MVAFTGRVTQKTGKHPFPQQFTAFAALDKEAAEKFLSGHLMCRPLHDYGVCGDVDGRDGGGEAPSRFGFDPLEAAAKCYETERGTVVCIRRKHSQQQASPRMPSGVCDGIYSLSAWQAPSQQPVRINIEAHTLKLPKQLKLPIAFVLNVANTRYVTRKLYARINHKGNLPTSELAD